MRTTPKKSLVQTLLLGNPQAAKKAADLLEVDFGSQVRKAIKTALKKVEQGEKVDYVDKIAEAFRLCDPIVQQDLEYRITMKNVVLLWEVLPTTFSNRNNEAIPAIIASAESDPKFQTAYSRTWELANMEVSFPGITDQVVEHINEDPTYLEMDPLRLAHKLHSLSFEEKANPGFLPRIWELFIIGQIVRYPNAAHHRDFAATEISSVEESELPRIFEEAVTYLVNSGLAADGAHVAKSRGMQDLTTWAATISYTTCSKRGQYKEAAELADLYGIPDNHNAAKKRLETLLAERKPHWFAIESWVDRFNLAIDEKAAHRYSVEYDKGSPEFLISQGWPDIAKDLIQERFRNSGLFEGLGYYTREDSLFSIEEAVNTVADWIAYLARYTDAVEQQDKLIGLLKGTRLENSIDSICSLALDIRATSCGSNEWMETFIQNHCPTWAPDPARLKTLAARMLEEGDLWRYIRMCQNWSLDPLEEIETIEGVMAPLIKEVTGGAVSCLSDFVLREGKTIRP